MAEPARRPASYADIEAPPETMVGEIIDGALKTHRFLPIEGAALAGLSGLLGRPFDGMRGRPREWAFLPKPELHLGEAVVVPDLAGWRTSRFDMDPDTVAVVTPPDWICEILSPATNRLDRVAKRRIYASVGVEYLWLLDPFDGVLEAFWLVGGQWLLLTTVVRGEAVSVAPFDAISFPLDDLFPFDTPSSPEA